MSQSMRIATSQLLSVYSTLNFLMVHPTHLMAKLDSTPCIECPRHHPAMKYGQTKISISSESIFSCICNFSLQQVLSLQQNILLCLPGWLRASPYITEQSQCSSPWDPAIPAEYKGSLRAYTRQTLCPYQLTHCTGELQCLEGRVGALTVYWVARMDLQG